MKKVNALILGLAVLLAVGCGGDGDDPKPGNRTCKVIQGSVSATSNGANPGIFTNEAVYNNQGQIIEVINKHTDNTTNTKIIEKSIFDYDNLGNMISRKCYYQPQNELVSIFNYKYNANQLVSSIIIYTLVEGDTMQGATNTLLFQYDSNNRLTKYSIKRDTTLTEYEEYSYSGSNKVIAKGYVLNQPNNGMFELRTETIFELDSKKIPEHYELLQNHNWSKGISFFNHNILSAEYTQLPSGTSTIYSTTYQYNSDDYPVSYTETNSANNNIRTGSYTYNCQ